MAVPRRMRHNNDAKQAPARAPRQFGRRNPRRHPLRMLDTLRASQSETDGFGSQSMPTASNHQIRAVGARS
jgi:hypothetical protein